MMTSLDLNTDSLCCSMQAILEWTTQLPFYGHVSSFKAKAQLLLCWYLYAETFDIPLVYLQLKSTLSQSSFFLIIAPSEQNILGKVHIEEYIIYVPTQCSAVVSCSFARI